MSSKMPNESISIRPYRGDVDFPGLVAFLAFQYEHEREMQEHGRRHGGKIAPSYAAALLNAIEGHDGCLLIADIGNNPVGFIGAYTMNDPDPVLNDDVRLHGFVRDLFVLPNWRRMGVAKKLLEAAEKHFREHGVKRIRIAGPAQNTSMEQLCKAEKFSAYAIVYDREITQASFRMVDGQYVKGGA